MRKKKNGPCVTYKFIDDEHKRLFDAGKLSFEQAVQVKEAAPLFEFVTHYELTKVTEQFPHYVYPSMFRPTATRFAVVSKTTGEVVAHKYLYTNAIWTTYNDSELYVTNMI